MTGPKNAPLKVSVELFARTHTGKVRKNNEDNFLVADLTRGISGIGSAVKQHNIGIDGTLLLVSDGMGGALAGEVASRLAVEQLHQHLVVKRTNDSAEQRLLEAIGQTNERIYQTGQANPQYTGMGATLTATIVNNGVAYIAEIGDSRAYVIRFGTITQLTKDQSVVQRLIDQGEITAQQAAHHPHRNIILQSLGSQSIVNVVMSSLELCQHDILLLCTDGLSNKVPDQEIKEIVHGSLSIESACRNLIEAANRYGGEDNITVVLAKFSGSDLPLPEDELDITDAQQINNAIADYRRSLTGQYQLERRNTQQIMRRTQPIAIPLAAEPISVAPKFQPLPQSSSLPIGKIIAIIALLVALIVVLLKLR